MGSYTPLQQNFLRLRSDFALYAEKNLKIKTKIGDIVPFVLNDAQRYVHNLIEKQLAETGKVRVILLKGRQQGQSTMIQGRFYWKTSLNKGKQAFVITHEQSATDNLFGITNRYHDNSILKPQTGSSNAKELTFSELESGYRIGTAGTKSVGRSATFQLLHGCLAKGTKVVDPISGGIRGIETFVMGDIVKTHTGQQAKISFVSTQRKPCLSVVMRGLGKFPLVATPEHKFLTPNGWKELKDINPNDSIGYPLKTIGETIKAIDLPPANQRAHGGGRQHKVHDKIDINYDFGLIVGLYLAEGHISLQSKAPNYPAYITFSIHRSETPRTIEWLNKIDCYLSSVRITDRKDSLTTTIDCCGSRFASLINNLCGRVGNKHVPYLWSEMGSDFCKGLLHGYISGDGSSYGNEARIRATSIRPEITLPMRDIAAALGYGWAGIEYKKSGVRHKRVEKEVFTFSLCGDGAVRLAQEIGKPTLIPTRKKTVSIKGNAANSTQISDGYAWIRVRSITPVGIKDVYDFEVDHPDHSYCIINGATHNSEVGFWPNSQEILAGLFQCVPDMDGTEIILESTANGVGNTYHQMWQDAVEGKSDFMPIFLSWTLQPEYRRNAAGIKLTEEEKTLKKLYGLDNEQIAFRRAKIIELRGAELFNQEYPLSPEIAFLASGRPAFDYLQLKQAQLNCLKPRKRMALVGDKWLDNKDGELRIWFDRKPGETYSIGADVSMGIDGKGDYSSADVIENASGCQVANWHGKCSPDRYSDVLNALGRLYGDAFLCVEQNNHGLSTLILLRDRHKYRHLYVQRDIDNAGSLEKETRTLGFLTTAKSKFLLIDTLAEALAEKTHGISCIETIKEMSTYIVESNGSYNAQVGCYDDRVMSYALALHAVRTSYLNKAKGSQKKTN